MKIDSTHRPWLIGTSAALAIATITYALFAAPSLRGPRGGGAAVLAFGITGYALMIFTGLLGIRKKFPVWRIGRVQTWMRGHLWLGLLSFPLIVFHAGFGIGGPLTTILMLLLVMVIVSGVIGAALQHYLPRVMTRQVPMETIYEEIPHVREQLLQEADQLVEAATAGGTGRLREIYHVRVRPQLEQPSVDIIQPLRAELPETLHPVLDELEDICEEERQLNRQIRLYHWLHGWLLVHVPLSILLLVLGGVHAIAALLY
jgi:hypothetical protein